MYRKLSENSGVFIHEDVFVSLVHSTAFNEKITDLDVSIFTDEFLKKLFALSRKHDVAHLVGVALDAHSLIDETSEYNKLFSDEVIKAVYRYERINYEYHKICDILEATNVDFLPLKGSVIREYYLEPWMRTSCDIDILIHKNELERTISILVQNFNYKETSRSTHDVSLIASSGVHVEIHYELVEDYYANGASLILEEVWSNVQVVEGTAHHYKMSDEFFYYYHIAHMAKHFYEGGCGIRSFLDLFILDDIKGIDINIRDNLLIRGKLFDFASSVRKLSKVWFGQDVHDDLTRKMQDFVFRGGVYGSSQNRVALQQTKKGGKFGYVFSRIFISYDKLKRYYPILEKHRWLMPIMQIRRWGMLLDPSVARMAKAELSANKNMEKSTADDMNAFLQDIGL